MDHTWRNTGTANLTFEFFRVIAISFRGRRGREEKKRQIQSVGTEGGGSSWIMDWSSRQHKQTRRDKHMQRRIHPPPWQPAYLGSWYRVRWICRKKRVRRIPSAGGEKTMVHFRVVHRWERGEAGGERGSRVTRPLCDEAGSNMIAKKGCTNTTERGKEPPFVATSSTLYQILRAPDWKHSNRQVRVAKRLQPLLRFKENHSSPQHTKRSAVQAHRNNNCQLAHPQGRKMMSGFEAMRLNRPHTSLLSTKTAPSLSLTGIWSAVSGPNHVFVVVGDEVQQSQEVAQQPKLYYILQWQSCSGWDWGHCYAAAHTHMWNPRGGLCAAAPRSLLATTSHAGWPTFFPTDRCKAPGGSLFKLRTASTRACKDEMSIWHLCGGSAQHSKGYFDF